MGGRQWGGAEELDGTGQMAIEGVVRTLLRPRDVQGGWSAADVVAGCLLYGIGLDSLRAGPSGAKRPGLQPRCASVGAVTDLPPNAAPALTITATRTLPLSRRLALSTLPRVLPAPDCFLIACPPSRMCDRPQPTPALALDTR